MNPGTTPQIQFNVRAKILIVFLVLSMATLIIMGIAAVITISDIGNSAQESSTTLGTVAVRDSSAALWNGTEQYMIRIATDQADLVDQIFWSTEAELTLLADHARSVENSPAAGSGIRSYPVSVLPPDPMRATVVYIAPGSQVRETDPEYLALAGMDDMLASMYRTDGDLVSVYVATESGILRAYPWEGDLGPSYDPRTRSWFAAAKASDKVAWSEPYVDASGHGLILTSSKSIPTRYGTWVVASDVTVSQLSTYTNLTLGGKGYAVLLDDKGTVISRPGLGAGTGRWDQPFPAENALTASDPGLAAVGSAMVAGRTGVGYVRFNGTQTIVAYAPVRSLNWSYAVSLPAKEVVAPIITTESTIVNAT
ncbi:MAG: serine/threonine protein phosphatase, partial [Methanomicrobiales archaeon]|nr:serine/threonine protein phosphatase [Methanomicrobiales archaeon]